VAAGRRSVVDGAYVAVIFSSQRTDDDGDAYDETALEMERLAVSQPGYLGIESARDERGFGITVSYWRTEDDARAWKAVAEHRVAQTKGREQWYRSYHLRVATVTREYSYEADAK
jgi:heme-degrading monooxygenase HmoA